MARHVNTTLVVGASYASPKERPAFNARFTAVTAALQNHDITEASVIFAGDRLQRQDEPIQLAAPAAQLRIPELAAGNAVQTLLESWEEGGPALVVVMANLARTNQFYLSGLIHRLTHCALLFVTDGDPGGYPAASTLFGVSRQSKHVRVLMPAQDPRDVTEELDRLFMFTPLR